MDITLPNGRIVTGIPEGTTKEAVKLKAIAAGLATEADFGQPAAPQGDAARNINFKPTVLPEKKGILDSIKNALQGGEEGSRNVFSAPELNEFWNKQLKDEGLSSIGFKDGDVKPWQIFSGRAMKAGLGGLLTGDPAEIEQMIAANYPEAEFGDIGGQKGVRLPSGDYLLQPEGLDPLDVARFGTDVAAFTPAGGITGFTARQLGKGALVAGGTQAVMQGAEAGVGGEFNAGDVAIEAVTQGAFQRAEPLLKTAGTKVKEYVSPFIEKIAKRFQGGATDAPYKAVADAITSGKAKNMIPEIMADPEIMKAANDLGINVNPAVYSTSDIYREMENSLKAIPQSRLSANEKETVRKLSESADELITEWTGTTDKSAISEDFTERMLGTVKQMEDEASALYQTFDEIIPKSLKIKPQSTLDYISRQITDLGGIENLDPKTARMYDQITQEGGPTYALLDKLRRDVGSALKGQGPFKDASQNELKQLYGTLTDDTLRGAEFFGLADEVQLAKGLVKDRKALEDSLQGALGKDLSKSLMAELGAGVKQLQQGKTAKFNQVMNSIPEEDRQMVAISALNDIFAGGATKSKDFSLGGFVGSYEALKRNARASDQLMKYIPPEVKKRMDDIYKVSKGLMDANVKDLNNPSGSARAIIGAMDAPNGIMSKLYNVGRQTATGAAATSPFDMGVVGATAGFMNAIKSAKTKATQAADEMLSSPAFQDSMQKYINGDSVAANGVLNRLKSTRDWIAGQSPEVKRAITRQGLIQYLTADDK